MSEMKEDVVRVNGMDDRDPSDEIPNAETVAAMDEYYEMIEHPEKYKRYSSFKELLDEALNDAS